MLARTGPRGRRATWSRGSGPVGRPGPGDGEASVGCSDAGLRWPGRGDGPERSGNSLRYASPCRPSSCTGAGSASWTGALLCSGRAGSGRGAAKAAGAAVPVMNRFSRAPTSPEWPLERGSAFGEVAGVERCGGRGRSGRRGHCRPSLTSGTRPGPAPGGAGRCAPPRSGEPLRSPGLSPGLGYPGSFGEVIAPGSLRVYPGRPGGGGRVGVGSTGTARLRPG